MRTTVTLDDELLKDAVEFTGIKEKSLLVNAALKALVEREAARRAAALGGTMPGFKAAPRKRPWVEPRRRRSKVA
jgi:Arc/MetJ family transcription regulator